MTLVTLMHLATAIKNHSHNIHRYTTLARESANELAGVLVSLAPAPEWLQKGEVAERYFQYVKIVDALKHEPDTSLRDRVVGRAAERLAETVCDAAEPAEVVRIAEEAIDTKTPTA